MIVYDVNKLPEGMVTAAQSIRTAKEAVLWEAFEKVIKSDVFMSFEDKVDALLDAMSIPISDDKSYNQFYIHSEKDLATKALMDAFTKKEVPVLPTVDEIHAEAKRRYDEKIAKEERKAARRAGREVGKAAPQVDVSAATII